MTHTWPDGESIHVTADQDGCPQRFVWQNAMHRVQAIHQQWQVDADWWSDAGRVWRDYFVVTTAEGLLCVLYYDHLGNAWRLTKVYD
jgi:hypothetical protein